MQVSINQIDDSFEGYLKKCEDELVQKLNHTYLCMLFNQFSGELVKAVKDKRYKFFGENGLLDSCLQE